MTQEEILDAEKKHQEAGELAAYLRSIDACSDAVEWVGNRDLASAWARCERADWMLWLLSKRIGTPSWPTHPDVVRLVCDCVERALRFVPEGEDRPRLAIEAARRWAEEPTKQNRAAAAEAASRAAGAAGASWAAAAEATSRAAWAVSRASWAAAASRVAAAEAAAWAVSRASWAAEAVSRAAQAAEAAGADELRAMSDLVRKAVPTLPEIEKD